MARRTKRRTDLAAVDLKLHGNHTVRTTGTCVLGYEMSSATNTTCVKPEFRPHSGWEGSSGQALLQLQGIDGGVLNGTDANTPPILLTEHTYTIPAPMLEPKERMFAGYQQPYVFTPDLGQLVRMASAPEVCVHVRSIAAMCATARRDRWYLCCTCIVLNCRYSKIQYELDFSLGAEVDIGCGTAVVGDAAVDANIPRTTFAHPLSMHHLSWQYPMGRGDLKADPQIPGHFANRCPRYHRFRVTRPGNVTFDTCASMMTVGVEVFKRTNDSNASEPRIAADWTAGRWQGWEKG